MADRTTESSNKLYTKYKKLNFALIIIRNVECVVPTSRNVDAGLAGFDCSRLGSARPARLGSDSDSVYGSLGSARARARVRFGSCWFERNAKQKGCLLKTSLIEFRANAFRFQNIRSDMFCQEYCFVVFSPRCRNIFWKFTTHEILKIYARPAGNLLKCDRII
jgi:hypothetical protein